MDVAVCSLSLFVSPRCSGCKFLSITIVKCWRRDESQYFNSELRIPNSELVQSPRHVPTLRAASTHGWSGGTSFSARSELTSSFRHGSVPFIGCIERCGEMENIHHDFTQDSMRMRATIRFRCRACGRPDALGGDLPSLWRGWHRRGQCSHHADHAGASGGRCRGRGACEYCRSDTCFADRPARTGAVARPN